MPVEESVSEIPAEYKLYQNFPNPFNPSTKIKFAIPVTMSEVEGSLVTLKVYDVFGGNLVDNLAADVVGHFTEDGVASLKPGGWCNGDKEL